MCLASNHGNSLPRQHPGTFWILSIDFLLAPDMLQAQQLQVEAENSLKHAKREAAALLLDKERLHAQLHQQQAAATGASVGTPVPNVPQVKSYPQPCLDRRRLFFNVANASDATPCCNRACSEI